MPLHLRALTFFFLLILACSRGTSSPAPGPEPDDDRPRARIENRASVDMDIYLVRSSGERHRLGFIPGGETATFALPPTLTAGTTSIIFEAEPVRHSGQPITSEPFGVHTGQEITWSISPQ